MDISLALPEQEIHIWLTAYDQIADPRLLAAYRQLLSGEEIDQEQRFHFLQDRQRYLVTRALVRTCLSRYSPIRPADWTFECNKYGRPRITASQAAIVNLSFNISHTQGLIVLGITKRRAIGVDVESIVGRRVPAGLADAYFAPAEALALAALAPEDHPFHFFEYWTFKEAYIKARGLGLSLPLDKFSIHYPGSASITMKIAPDLGGSQDWQFWQIQPSPRHLIAVCVERVDLVRPHLIVRESIPMVGENAAAYQIRRMSS